MIDLPAPAPGNQHIVIQGEHGMVIMGNVNPATLPRWQARENADGTTTYYNDPKQTAQHPPKPYRNRAARRRRRRS